MEFANDDHEEEEDDDDDDDDDDDIYDTGHRLELPKIYFGIIIMITNIYKHFIPSPILYCSFFEY